MKNYLNVILTFIFLALVVIILQNSGIIKPHTTPDVYVAGGSVDIDNTVNVEMGR